ncbi:MAG TPA: NAD(P)H-binding protein [Bacteroidales bacterium]|nr:NAD(P)H-binding protein [Bacteroidales bacterium]
MEGPTATVIGATGLIGNQLVELLENDDFFKKIRVVARRQVDFNNPSIDIRVINFSDESAFRTAISGSDAVFCAVGTTNRKVNGDKDAYRNVDYDIPVNAAKYCKETGIQKFLLVSSVGANSKSNNFYLRFKGEVEDNIRKLNLNSVTVFRPSMLLGDREEFRAGELLGKALAVPMSIFLPSNYRPIHARNVAKAMIRASKKTDKGFKIYQYKDMMELVKE